MSASAERRAPLRLAALALAGLLSLGAVHSGAGWAQGNDDDRRTAVSDAAAAKIGDVIADPDTTTADLEALRDHLVAQRAEAQEAEKNLQPPIDEINARIKALGDPPAEGASEAPEIAQRRKDLNDQLSKAMAPILEARDTYQRADGQIAEIDRIVRARFSAELMSSGPTPLRPSVWTTAASEIGGKVVDYGNGVWKRFQDPANRQTALTRLPRNLALLALGIGLSILIRRGLVRWVDTRLRASASPHARTWAVALRNLARLIVPLGAAGLLFAALDPEGLVARAGSGRFFEIPGFVLVTIGAAWLAASLFAPRYPAHRLMPLDDRQARQGAWVTLALGVVLGLQRLGSYAIAHFDFSQGTQTAIFFPLVVLGALGLLRTARIIDRARASLAPGVAQGQSPTALLGLRFLHLLSRALRVVAVVGPALALVGYLPAGAFLVFSSILTIGLLGSGIVVYDLLTKTALHLLASPNATSGQDDAGLVPIVAGTLLSLAALPPLALIWGARTSDLSEAWSTLNGGVTLGGMRLSLGVVLTLVIVFALGAGLTRLIQTILRASVLPRTKLDTGGRNAVAAGIGYLGFVLAALVAVSAAGLDLSNIAIVAGALSVGIGFGLQNLVSNFVSGIILLVERPVKEGDWIEVGGFSGYVKGINVRSTEIQTFDRASVILPNSDLVAGTVLNRTHTGSSGRVQIPIGVSYEAQPRQVEGILLAIAEEHPLVLEEPSPVVLFMGFSVNTMDFELRCWLRDVNFSMSARSDINFDIVERFRAAGIEFRLPPPVQHVHRLDEVSAEFLMAAQDAAAAEKAKQQAEEPAAAAGKPPAERG